MIKIVSNIYYYNCGTNTTASNDEFAITHFEESDELREFIRSQWNKKVQTQRTKPFGTGTCQMSFSIKDENGKTHPDSNKLNNFVANPNKTKCSQCSNILTSEDDFEWDVCSSCIDTLENKTGYCSLSCRLGNGCDDSC